MTVSAVASDVRPDGRISPRRVDFAGRLDRLPIDDRRGYDVEAIVGLHPFMVDDQFVTLLARQGAPLDSSVVIRALRAAIVRPLLASEVLLGFRVGAPRHRVLIDSRLLEQPELLFCIDPPHGYAAMTPQELQQSLRATAITLPAR